MTDIEIIKGKVAKILNNYRVVVNVGYDNGVKKDMKFIIYSEGETIRDPDTNQELSKVEFVKARIEPIHIQEKITIMETYEKEVSKLSALFGNGSAIERQKPFITNTTFKAKSDNVNMIVIVGDLVRQDLS